MLAALSRRVGRVEVRTDRVRRFVPPTQCAWEWSERLAAWSPRYEEMVAWALPLAETIAPAYPRPAPPRLRADFLLHLLIEHSRLALFKDKLEQWHPTQEEMTSTHMFTELAKMGKAYVAATGDFAPFPLIWADYEGWEKRSKSRRR